VSLLSANFPEFDQDIRQGHYRVVRGDFDTGMELTVDLLGMSLGNATLHLEPIIEGAASGSGKGIAKAVIGVALIAAAVFQPEFLGFGASGLSVFGTGLSIPAASIGMFGLALAVSGVAQAISPTPTGKVDPHASFLFGSIQNITQQGSSIPLTYGRIRVGSIMISADIQTTDDIQDTPGFTTK
jgi:predicted phage tail protein